MNPAQIYDQAYQDAIVQFHNQGLDPKDPEIKKIARDMANKAVKRAQGN